MLVVYMENKGPYTQGYAKDRLRVLQLSFGKVTETCFEFIQYSHFCPSVDRL